MANKRTLKHGINLICEKLFIECVAASLYGTSHKDNANSLLASVIQMQSDFICRVSHVEPGMKPKVYYKKLCEQFAAHVSEKADQINNF